MSITYTQLKLRIADPSFDANRLTEQLIAASNDLFYIHQLRFEAEREGRLDLNIVLKVLRDGLNAEYLQDIILCSRNDSEALSRLYQLAYDEEQMMNLVLLLCWERNVDWANRFLHYFVVSPSQTDTRTRFVARVVDVCLDRQTPSVVETALQALPYNTAYKLVYFLEKAYKVDNPQIASVLLQHINLLDAIDLLMAEHAQTHAIQTCDWLLKDEDDMVWNAATQRHPEILDSIYSVRRTLMLSLGVDEGGNSSGRKKL